MGQQDDRRVSDPDTRTGGPDTRADRDQLPVARPLATLGATTGPGESTMSYCYCCYYDYFYYYCYEVVTIVLASNTPRALHRRYVINFVASLMFPSVNLISKWF